MYLEYISVLWTVLLLVEEVLRSCTQVRVVISPCYSVNTQLLRSLSVKTSHISKFSVKTVSLNLIRCCFDRTFTGRHFGQKHLKKINLVFIFTVNSR